MAAEKIENVLTKFNELYNTSKDNGVSALIRSGIKSIDTEEQLQYIINEIEKTTNKNQGDTKIQPMRNS